MCVGDSFFEGTSFVYWPSRDRVSISPRSCIDFISRDRVSISLRLCVDFARCSLEFVLDLKNLHRGGEL